MNTLRALPATLIIGLLIIAIVVLNLVIWAIYRGLRSPGKPTSSPVGRFGQSLTQSPFQAEDRDLAVLHDRVSQLTEPGAEHKPSENESNDNQEQKS